MLTLYTKPECGNCRSAKALLQSKGVRFEEISLARNPKARDEMIRRARGRMTLPQIFLGDRHIGDLTDLRYLDEAGRLDALLGQA